MCDNIRHHRAKHIVYKEQRCHDRQRRPKRTTCRLEQDHNADNEDDHILDCRGTDTRGNLAVVDENIERRSRADDRKKPLPNRDAVLR